jgi:sulfate transporter 3
MGTAAAADGDRPLGAAASSAAEHKVNLSARQPFVQAVRTGLAETFFPDDPFRGFGSRPPAARALGALKYFVPALEWAPRYSVGKFKYDLLAGVTIASLAIPQGISYAKLANLPPIIGLCMRAMHLFSSGLNSTSAFSVITTIDVDVRLCTRSPQPH